MMIVSRVKQMFKNESMCDIQQKKNVLCRITTLLFLMVPFEIPFVFAQAPEPSQNSTNINQSDQSVIRALPENLPEANKPTRKIHRIGTVIPAPPNAVSIKSTEAGVIRRPTSSPSGCMNCGAVDFIHQSLQGNQLSAIVNGVVAGTVAREIIRPGTNTHVPQNPNYLHQVGITLNDGRQVIIGVPDASHLQQGDRVKLMDGTVVIDRE